MYNHKLNFYPSQITTHQAYIIHLIHHTIIITSLLTYIIHWLIYKDIWFYFWKIYPLNRIQRSAPLIWLAIWNPHILQPKWVTSNSYVWLNPYDLLFRTIMQSYEPPSTFTTWQFSSIWFQCTIRVMIPLYCKSKNNAHLK